MSLQYILLLTFIGGAFSAWGLMRMSQISSKERTQTINDKVASMGGHTLSVDIVDRKECPFSREYQDRDRVYKFYQISYELSDTVKHGWAVQSMAQQSYGPSSAIHSQWTWRL